ncbi:MAG TPA: PAS domain S-box protein [Pyrinomonadaceae bacterium]|nr:PAS domain S-box protein [Pyrinomonadaceae bacterium]
MRRAALQAKKPWAMAARLAFSFAVLIAAVTVVDWFALRQMSRADRALDAVVDERWERVQLTRDAESLSSLNARLVWQAFITNTPAELQDLNAQIAINSNRISELFATLRSNGSGPRECELLDLIDARRQAYISSYRDALDSIVKGGSPADGQTLLTREVSPLLTSYRQALDEYVAYQGQQVDDAQELNLRANMAARRQAGILISLATAFAVVIAIFVTVYMARQLTRLSHAEGKLREAHQQLEAKVIRRTQALSEANQELLDSEQRYRMLFDANPHPMWVFDSDTLAFLAVNDAAVRCYGYSRAEFLGMTIKDIRPREEVASLFNLSAEVIDGFGSYNSHTWHHRKKDGSIIDVEISWHTLNFAGRPAKLVLVQDVTERRRAESEKEKLHTETLLQTARFHQLFENTPMGIVMVDPNDRVVHANPEFQRMFQFSPNELMDRPLNELIIPSGMTAEATDLSSRTFNREIVKREAIRCRRDGVLMPVEIYGVPIIADDVLVGVFAIYIDLSAQKRLELERETVADIIHGAISPMALEDLFKLIHASISKVLYAENCFVGLHDPATDLMHYDFWIDKHDPAPSPRPVAVGFSGYILQTGKSVLLTEEMRDEYYAKGIVKRWGTASGSWLGVPLRIDSRIIGVLAVQHYEMQNVYSEDDLHYLESVGSQIAMVIERKQSEQALFEANERALRDYEHLVERIASLGQTLGTARELKTIYRALRDFASASVPCDGLVISLYGRQKESRRIAYCWTDGEECDYSNGVEVPVREGMVGRAIKTGAVVIDNDFAAAVAENPSMIAIGARVDPTIERSALAAPMTVMGRTVGCVEVQCHHSNAFENGHATAMRMAANLAANAIENVMLLEREQETEEQLRQAQKMESIGTLAGGIAHDFNNLMTAVTGYSELILRSQLEDSLRTKIEEIKKAGDRAASLTRQLLAFSRRQMLQPKVLDLNEVVNGMIKMLPRLIGEHISISLKLDGAVGRIKADPGQIEQVILNLAVNARDAMPDGGHLTIETCDVRLAERVQKAGSIIEPGRYAMLAVSDDGCGMDQETQTHIFEPFFTTKGVGKGTGLGLSTVYGIVKQSDGHVWVYSEPAAGTTFKIFLPRVDEVDAIVHETETASVARGKETILLVEDEEQVRNLSKEVLESYGYSVLTAVNGLAGLRTGEEFGGRIDLVLTDVIMPQMSGKELIEKWKVLRPESKVLYMSGFTDDAIIHHGVLDDGVFFLQKPFTTESLAAKVREVLDQ